MSNSTPPKDWIRNSVYLFGYGFFVFSMWMGVGVHGHAVLALAGALVVGFLGIAFTEALVRRRLAKDETNAIRSRRITAVASILPFCAIGLATLIIGIMTAPPSAFATTKLERASSAAPASTDGRDVRTVTARSGGSYPCLTTYKKLLEYATATSDSSSPDYDNHALLDDAMSDAVSLTGGTSVHVVERSKSLDEVKLTVLTGPATGTDCFIPLEADNYSLFKEGP